MQVSPAGEPEQVVTFLAPVIRSSGACDSVMIYQIHREQIDALFGDTWQGQACYLLDEAGQIVWKMGENPAMDSFLEAEGAQAQTWEDARRMKLNGKQVAARSSPCACAGFICPCSSSASLRGKYVPCRRRRRARWIWRVRR